MDDALARAKVLKAAGAPKASRREAKAGVGLRAEAARAVMAKEGTEKEVRVRRGREVVAKEAKTHLDGR